MDSKPEKAKNIQLCHLILNHLNGIECSWNVESSKEKCLKNKC